MNHFNVAVKAFIVEGNQVLLTKRSSTDIQSPGHWEIPGGRIHLHEDPKEGLLREIREELGIEVKILHPIETDHFVRSDGQRITMIIFLCTPLSKNIQLSSEHEDHKWVQLEHAREKIMKEYHFLLDTYEHYFLK